jgi:signal transduction histidine kinase
MNRKTFDRLLILLLGLTLLALYAHANWLDRNLRIDLLPNTTISAIDDRPEGGKSIATLIKTKNGLVLNCNIQDGYQWKFCQLDIRLSQDNSGINFDEFETLSLQIKSKGAESQHPLRVFLRNFDPAYSIPGDDGSLKAHEVVYEPNKESSVVTFNLSQFMVASWWVQEHPTSVKYLGPQLQHVTAFAVATGGSVQNGEHEITLVSAELRGHWISAESFRLAIICVWIFSMITYLLIEWRQSRTELGISVHLRDQLRLSNEVLESRVEERTRALAASNAQLIESTQNLEGARHELVESEKNAALGSLVAGISHELNTPVGNAILVASTLTDNIKAFKLVLSSGLSRSALNEFIIELENGTGILNQNLKRSVDLISSFKQLAVDQHSGQRRSFNLLGIIEETRLAMSPRLRQKRHELILLVNPHITMEGYPGPLSQILMNFINNALIHAFEGIEQGKMQIEAELINSNTEKPNVRIVFSDNGAGISASNLKRIFEPFFTTKLGKGGSGLGMHLAHNLITQVFGGSIKLESTLGSGTTITLELPLVAPLPSDSHAKVGIPKDVLDDYILFLNGRNIADVDSFSGKHSRRDVVELGFFLRLMQTSLPNITIDLIPVDSYAEGIEKVRTGTITALATSLWHSDLLPYQNELIISDAIIADGASIVGLYTRANDLRILSCQTLEQLRECSFISNRDWSADWTTLEKLQVRKIIDVKTWRQMVYLVSAGEVDILLSPFSLTQDLRITFDDCQFLPIPNVRLALDGSRHFVASQNGIGKQIADSVFPDLISLVENGTFEQALIECGFCNHLTSAWPIINANRN